MDISYCSKLFSLANLYADVSSAFQMKPTELFKQLICRVTALNLHSCILQFIFVTNMQDHSIYGHDFDVPSLDVSILDAVLTVSPNKQ